MSNPVKKLKKNFKKIVTAVIVAAVAYAAFPVIAGALATGGAASAAGAATTAAGAAGTAGGLGAAGAAAGLGTAASAGGGLLGTLGSGLGAAATAFKGASPMVKLGLIQTGGQMLQGALTPEPLTAAEQDAERLAVLHSQPSSARTFTAGQAGIVQQPVVEQTGVSAQPQAVATLNPATGLFEQAS